MTHHVETATETDKAAVYATLTLAFSTDPMARWSWPDPLTHLKALPLLSDAFAGAAFGLGSAHRIAYSGVALWLPPGHGPDEAALEALMRETVRPEIHAEVGQVMEQMERFHPKEPHWYLPMIGTDPAHQSKGMGGALLEHALAFADRDGVPAYLESSNPRNIPLYERHGFERLGNIQAGSSPTVTPMLRKPRRR